MASFDPCIEFEFFWGQMTLFEVLVKCHFMTLSKRCRRLCPSAYMREYIGLSQQFLAGFQKLFLFMVPIKFLAMLEGKIREAPFYQDSI